MTVLLKNLSSSNLIKVLEKLELKNFARTRRANKAINEFCKNHTRSIKVKCYKHLELAKYLELKVSSELSCFCFEIVVYSNAQLNRRLESVLNEMIADGNFFTSWGSLFLQRFVPFKVLEKTQIESIVVIPRFMPDKLPERICKLHYSNAIKPVEYLPIFEQMKYIRVVGITEDCTYKSAKNIIQMWMQNKLRSLEVLETSVIIKPQDIIYAYANLLDFKEDILDEKQFKENSLRIHGLHYYSMMISREDQRCVVVSLVMSGENISDNAACVTITAHFNVSEDTDFASLPPPILL